MNLLANGSSRYPLVHFRQIGSRSRLALSAPLLQQLRLGRIHFAAVIAKIEFDQVQPEGASLRKDALHPAARGAPGLLPQQSPLHRFERVDDIRNPGLAGAQFATELRELCPEALVRLKRS